MSFTPFNNVALQNKFGTPVLLALITAGLAGNYLNYPIFLNIDFLFGSIFAMLALQSFGLARGVLSAAIISGYTYILWNHPYAIVIMTAEVAVVGWLMGRRKVGLVLADTLYWLIIGMPLVYLFYHFVMQIPSSDTVFFMTKQAVNGIANAVVARLIFTWYALRSRSSLASYREIIYNLLALFVLGPTLIMLAVGSRRDFTETDRNIRSTLIQNSLRVDQRLETWVENRKTAIINLAEMVASRTPQQMQPYLELVKKSDLNFQRVGLQDRESTSTAIFPLLDEQGQSAIGKNFADRPYIQQLKKTRKSTLSQVVMGRVGIPKPIVLMLAPVTVRGEYGGYVSGILNLDQIKAYLDKSLSAHTSLYTLLDKNGTVIMTNRTDQTVMTTFVRGKGRLNRLDQRISQWVPLARPNTPYFEAWKQSFYVVESGIGTLTEWRLILEQPVAPFQKTLYDNYTGKLILLFLILLGSLALAELMSRKIIVTLGQLRALTDELPLRLAKDEQEITWPESGIIEAHHLINNFRDMANSLSEQFREVRQINRTLEQRVAARTEELQESERHTNNVLDSLPSHIAVIDTNGLIVTANEPWRCFARENGNSAAISNYIGENYLSVCRASIDSDGDEWATAALGGIQAVLLGEADYFSLEYPCHSPDEQRWFLMTVSSLRESHKGAVVSHTNITKAKQADEQLLHAKNAAESANIAKSRFLATMSHEIRTPMNGVIGMLELLQHSELTREQYEYAESAKKSGIELVRLLNDILDLSKIEADKLVLESSDFDLRPMISDTINLLSLQAREKDVDLSTTIDDDVPMKLRGDAGRVRQIISNLIGNAIKFTPTGSVVLHVRNDTESDHSVTLRFLVRDSGIGIAAGKLGQIFEPFTQADSSTTRRYGGTGLGLAICKRLSELMGGRIGVESVEGQGSTFWFTVVVEKQGDVPASLEGNTPASGVNDGGGVADIGSRVVGREDSLYADVIRILLTEDDPNAQKILPKLLKKYGYLVDVAGGGSEALQALETREYALVLMDCMMPEMSGYEVTAVIRNPDSTVLQHDIPVIALTGNAMKEDRDRCIAAGMDDHLSKPLILDTLLVMLKKWVSSDSAPRHNTRHGSREPDAQK